MRYLDFLADAAVGGRLLGIGVGSTLTEVEQAFGPEASFVEDVHKSNRMMRRDYGLIELGFSRAGPGDVWACVSASIQVHRLSLALAPIVPQGIERVYGNFPLSVAFSVLENTIIGMGAKIENDRMEHDRDFARYSVSGTGNQIFVTLREISSGAERLNVGDVWAITLGRS